MSKTTTRSILVCVAAIPLSIALATPAAAAPGDVTYSVTTAGATVTSTFNNNLVAEIQCEYFGLNEPYDPETDYAGSYPYAVATGTVVVPVGQTASMTALAIPVRCPGSSSVSAALCTAGQTAWRHQVRTAPSPVAGWRHSEVPQLRRAGRCSE